MSDVEADMAQQQVPLIPEWLTHDPSLQPGALGHARGLSPRFRHDTFEESLHDGPTLPPVQVRTRAPAQAVSETASAARAYAPPARIAVVEEPSPDDWVLVAVGVGLTSSMLTLLLMLVSGYGSV